MKLWYILLCLVFCFFEINAFNRERRQFQMLSKCPEGMYLYSSPCTRVLPTWSEPTCDEPKKYDLGNICDWIACYCNRPNVRDISTDNCVALENCPKRNTTL